MKLPTAFIPKKNLDKEVTYYLEHEPDSFLKKDSNEKYLLMLSRSFNSDSTDLYFWNSSFEEPCLLRTFPYVIWSMCLFKGELYLGLYAGTILKLPGEKFVTKRDHPVANLRVHNDKIYDAGFYDGIFETLSDKLIDVRNQPVRELYSYGGVLYDCGFYEDIYDTLKGKKAFDCPSGATSLFCGGNYFYAGIYEGIFNLNTRILEAKRKGIIEVMGEYNGVCYDAGDYNKVFMDFSDETLFDLPDKPDYGVVDMKEASAEVLTKLVHY